MTRFARRSSYQMPLVVWFVCAALICIVALPAAAQTGLKEVLEHEAAALTTQLYRRAETDVTAEIAAGERKTFPLQLVAGVANAVIVACAEHCDRIEVSLFDAQRTLLMRDLQQSVVIIGGNPGYSGVHELDVSLQTCQSPKCEIAVAVLRQELPSRAPSEAVVTNKADARPKDKPAVKTTDRPKKVSEKSQPAHDHHSCAPKPNESYFAIRRRWSRCPPG